MIGGKRRGRISLGRVSGHMYWELRVLDAAGPGGIVTVRLTADDLSDLLAGALTGVEIEVHSEGGGK